MNRASGASLDDTREDWSRNRTVTVPLGTKAPKLAHTDNRRANSACMTSFVGAVPTNATRGPFKTIAQS